SKFSIAKIKRPEEFFFFCANCFFYTTLVIFDIKGYFCSAKKLTGCDNGPGYCYSNSVRSING
ncbi:MAG TPA: hypothetical protein PKD35_02865, partial [Nitrosomonas sp.]|nr:hypothetical protein [Nitrosomonas sp.]